MRSALFVALIAAGATPSARASEQSPAPPSVAAATAGTRTVSGRVITAGGQPAIDSQVELLELGRRSTVDETGAFRFETVPPGAYLLQAHSARWGSAVTRIEVADQAIALDVILDRAQHSETVVVSATAEAATLSELAQPVSVLSGTDLLSRLQPTLGETLAQQPGVSSTYFGPGASRPVIRGLGGDRIRVLESGVGTGDASSTSPDHAVSYDPLSARQIEVVRGPATLLYGSNAVGGIVNVLDDRVPDGPSDKPIHGRAALAGATAADDRSGAASLNGGGGLLAWHADFLKRDADDVNIPGFARSAELRAEDPREEEARDTLPNSYSRSTSGALGASLVGARGFLGVSFSGLDTNYGSPAEEEVHIELRQRRGDIRGEWHQPVSGLRNLRLRIGIADYEHTEFEGEEPGTKFTNEAWEGRLEAAHGSLGPFQGTVGVQAGHRDFAALGEEAFVPPSTTGVLALFAFEEAHSGDWRFQLGGRYERQDTDANGDEPLTRDFSAVSGSAGIVYAPGPAWSAALTVARSVKLPNAEELFANGPHLATGAFEIGDPDLGKENSLGFDVSLRRHTGRVTGDLTLFLNRFDGFIFEQLTGEEEDGLQVIQYLQRDAEFFGAEAEVRIDLVHREPHHLHADLSADYVHAELRDIGEPLPRIPPVRLGAALHYDAERWTAGVEVRGAAKQDRVSPFERPTDGYALLNATLGLRLFAGRNVAEFMLRGTNLTNAEARTHVSFLKDIAPLPGRDVRLDMRFSF
jgi:iron complex outermembrane receptor protein